MNYLVTGASGFIGKALCKKLLSEGHSILALTHKKTKSKQVNSPNYITIGWDETNVPAVSEQLNSLEGVFNLAGEGIASGLWTKAKKERILFSRVKTGKRLVELIRSLKKKPRFFIQASAIGYYGIESRNIENESAKRGKGFLAEVTEQWETSTSEIESMGVSRIVARIGFVLGQGGGALGMMILPFRFYLGGPVGSGNQIVSWIHLKDLIEGLTYIINQQGLSGIFNFTAPQPVNMYGLSEQLGLAINRPSWLKVPAFSLRLMMGQMAEEMLLAGNPVKPERLKSAGYEFQFPHIRNALKDIYAS